MGLFESARKRGWAKTIERLEKNFFPDMGHMLSAPSTTVYEDIPDNKRIAVVDRLMKRAEGRNGQADVWNAVSTLPRGTYAMRDHVGRTTEGTNHSHFFIIDRDETGATLLFVDSEANLNQSPREKGQLLREADFRPQVCNLMAVRIKDGETQPDIAMTRFRTEKIKDLGALSFEALLTLTRDLFNNKGIPPALEDVQNTEVVFRLILEPSRGTSMLVQTRDTKDIEGMRQFLRGESVGSSMLQGQIDSAAATIVGDFPARLHRGEFVLRTNLAPKEV